MRLGSKVHDPIGPEIGESLAHGLRIADVGLKQLVVRIALEISQRAGVARVGELVDVENLMPLRDKKMDEIGADEAGPASDENFHGWVKGDAFCRYSD